MKYEVTVGTLWVHGRKKRRGDIVELADATEFGARVQPYHEPVVEKPKRTRRKKVDAE